MIKSIKPLRRPGIEPGTPTVLRSCHNQLDHQRDTDTLCNSTLRSLTLLVGSANYLSLQET